MDETLTRPRILGVLVLLAAALAPGLAQALPQVLRDPTRPPPLPGQALTGAEAAQSARAPQLQSVLVARGGRHVAVIDGQSVRVGDSFRGARVTRIDDDEVQLTRGRERQVLRLHASGQPGEHGAARRAPTQNDQD